MNIKKFRIVLDGIAHEVEVEELGTVVTSTVAVSATPVQEAPTPEASVSLSQAVPSPTIATGEIVCAPMQGTILDVRVSVGENVSAGQVVAIIEAMKMENEIVAPCAGVVNGIITQKGDVVSAGQPLVTLQ